jgi:hypothetical protein
VTAARDMSGLTVGKWAVLLQEPSSRRGNARWLCLHRCEKPKAVVIEGRWLRVKPPKCCDGCRPKRVGKWGSNYE